MASDTSPNAAGQLPPSLPLITYDPLQGYMLQEAACSFLRNLPQDKNCHVLCIVGKVKTGKSFLLNELLKDNDAINKQDNHSHHEHTLKEQEHTCHQQKDVVGDPFEVSSNLQACTRGIALSTRYLQVQEGIVLFLDCEGFGGINKNQEQDCQLFVLTILLSSTLIYNSVGTIDEAALTNLSMVIKIGKVFENSLQLSGIIGMPSLFWVLRDFALKMENKKGDILSAAKYLQDALQQQKGSTQVLLQKNRIRRTICELFETRDCETLVIPSEQTSITNRSVLRPEFVADLCRLKTKLMQQILASPKKLNNAPLKIDDYIGCMTQFVKAVNSGGHGLTAIEHLPIQLHRLQVNKLNEVFKLRSDTIMCEFRRIIDSLPALTTLKFWEKEEEPNSHELAELANKIPLVDEMMGSLQKLYQEICRKVSGLLSQNGITQFNGKEAALKQFHTIHSIKNHCVLKMRGKLEQMKGFVMHRKQQQDQSGQAECEKERMRQICQSITQIMDENKLDQRYAEIIRGLKHSSFSMNNIQFENVVMHIEIAYLRRKLELRERNKDTICKHCSSIIDWENEIQQGELGCKGEAMKKSVEESSQGSGLAKNFHKRGLSSCSIERTGMLSSQKSSVLGKENRISKTATKSSFQTRWISCFKASNPERVSDTLRQVSDTQQQVQDTQLQYKSFYVPYLIIQRPQYINIDIIRTLIKEDSQHHNYIQYVLSVTLMDRRWQLNRKWKDFSELNNILHSMFPKVALPICEASLVTSKEGPGLYRAEQIEERRRQIERYIKQLLDMQFIRNCRIMQKFVKINKEYICCM